MFADESRPGSGPLSSRLCAVRATTALEKGAHKGAKETQLGSAGFRPCSVIPKLVARLVFHFPPRPGTMEGERSGLLLLPGADESVTGGRHEGGWASLSRNHYLFAVLDCSRGIYCGASARRDPTPTHPFHAQRSAVWNNIRGALLSSRQHFVGGGARDPPICASFIRPPQPAS